MIIKARQIYTLAKYHESCNFTQTQFSSTATPGKQPSLPLSRWRLGFWIMTSSKSCIWMSALQCLQKRWSLHRHWSHCVLMHTVHTAPPHTSISSTFTCHRVWILVYMSGSCQLFSHHYGVTITGTISIICHPQLIEYFWLLKASLCQIYNDVRRYGP